jgi:hypothetical protein
MDKTDETDRAVAIARQKLREAFYASYNDLDVEGIVDAIVEVSKAVKEAK